MRTQAIQVNETNGDKGQDNRAALNRIDYSRSMGDECMWKEPFFINHYYSHPLGQCCCQQQDMVVRRGKTMVQCSTTQQPATTDEMSEKSQKPQQSSEINACTSIIQPPTYDAKNEQGTRTLQAEIRSHVVEPWLHFAQAPLPNQMNTVPLYAVDTTVPPPVTTKKEREEFQTHVVDNTKVP